MAASELLPNLYINSGKYCRFIYVCMQNMYTHTIFLCHLGHFLSVYFFDVIVFNMLKVYIYIVLCLLCVFYMAEVLHP